MMKLRNRSYVKYSTYALIAAFMVSMTPAGAMADISAGGAPVGTGDVEITGTTTVTGTLDASGATEVRLGTTVATELLVGAGSGADINVGEELNKLGDVLGTDYKNPTFSTLTATGDTTLGATTADSLTIGGTDIGATVATNTGDIATLRTDTDTLRTDVGTLRTDVDNNAANIAANTTQIAANTTQIATNTGDIGVLRTDVDTLRVDTNTLRTDVNSNTAEIGKIGTVLGADYKNPEFDSLKVTGETTLGGALSANAGATVTGGLTADTADVTGNATVGGTLGVTGETTLDGALTANAGATVTGGLTADTADVTGNATVGGNLDVTGDLSAANGTFGTKVEVGMAGNNTVIENGTVTATGLGKFGSLEAGSAEFSGLKVNGATELNGALDVNGNVDATGTIHAAGNISTDGNISAVNGTFSGDVSAKDGTFTGTMTAQDAVINNNLNVGNDATIDGTLSAGAGNVVADSSGLTVGNKVTVGAPGSQTTIENGDITTAGNVGIGGTLDVTGNTTLGGTLNVAGDATFASNAAVEGNFDVAGTTTLGGKLTANGGALINNGLEVNGDAAFNDNASIGNDLTVGNNASIEKNLTVKGESSLEGKVTIGTGDNQTIIDGDTVNTGTVNTDFANVDEKLTVGTAEGNQTFVEGSKITSEAGVQGTTVIDGGKLTVSKPVTTRTPGDDKTEIDGGNITATGKGTFGSLQVNGNANIGGDATVDGKLYANEGGVFSNSTVINGDGMEISENGTIAAYYGKYGMQVGRLTYDGMRNTLNVGGGTITGLADGGVYRGSSDAVTGNQLWQAYQRMDDLQESINIVGAHAAALSGLAPVPYNPYQPTTLSAAIGTYRDEYAVAVGVYHYVRDNVMFNLGASICSDGDLMGRAGISFAVGKKDKDKPALAQNMNDVQKQLMEVQYALQELKDENAALKKQLRKQ